MTVNEWTLIFGLTTPLRNKKGSFSSNRSQMYLDVHLTRQLKNKQQEMCKENAPTTGHWCVTLKHTPVYII